MPYFNIAPINDGTVTLTIESFVAILLLLFVFSTIVGYLAAVLDLKPKTQRQLPPGLFMTSIEQFQNAPVGTEVLVSNVSLHKVRDDLWESTITGKLLNDKQMSNLAPRPMVAER